MTTIIAKSRPPQAGAPTTWHAVLPIHPAAKLLPRISESELKELGEDIKQRGLLFPPVTIIEEDGVERLLDGISRLDAMEMAGLEVVTQETDLNPAIVCQTVPPGTDPYSYVLSVNVRRRHLSADQKRDVIVALLKAQPHRSNRQIAKQVGASHPHVAKVRREAEKAGDVETVTTSIDTRGRRQPAKKEKTQKTKTAEDPFSTKLHHRLNELFALCDDRANWPPLSIARKARLKKALRQLSSVRLELIDLAKPARPGPSPKHKSDEAVS